MAPGIRRVLLTLAMIYPAVLIAWGTRGGVGISIDSVSYVAAAQSFARGEGFVGFDGYPLTIFPPGYPALLGALLTFGLSVSPAAQAINLVAVVLLVWLTYLLARIVLDSANQALLAAGFVSLASATIATHSFAWSEAPFTVLLMSALVVLTRGMRVSAMSWRGIVGVGLLVSLATTMRYAGLAIVPVVAWAIWETSDRKRGWRVVAGVAISCVGPGAVVLRNLTLGSGPLGERYPGSLTLEGAFRSMVELLGGYIAPHQTTSVAPVVGVLVVVLLCVAAWVSWLRRERPVELVALFIFAYWLVILYGQTAARLDTVTERLGAPAFSAMVVLAMFGVRELGRAGIRQLAGAGRASEARARRIFVVVGSVALVAVAGLSAVHGLRLALQPFADGSSLSHPVAEPVEALAVAKALPAGVGVASNEPAALWWARQSGDVVELPPSPAEWPAERVSRALDRLIERVSSGEVTYLVYSDFGVAALTPEELASAGLRVQLVEELSDGRIYSVAAPA